MPKYLVDFTYVEPMLGSIELEASDEMEAETIAIEEIDKHFPEAQEIELGLVEEVA